MSATVRVVAVTGASRGIGRGCALAFAKQGAEVLLIARNSGQLEDVAREIRHEGGKARTIVCDVTRATDVQEIFDAFDRCDVLVNNAGANRPQPFLSVSLATLDELLALNVRSMFVTAQAAARVMARRGSGVIINMSSQMGHVGAANRTVYCMTKHAIEGLRMSPEDPWASPSATKSCGAFRSAVSARSTRWPPRSPFWPHPPRASLRALVC